MLSVFAGSADRDLNGSTGLEYLAIPVGYAEPLVVEVTMLSDDGSGGVFSIGANFVAEQRKREGLRD